MEGSYFSLSLGEMLLGSLFGVRPLLFLTPTGGLHHIVRLRARIDGCVALSTSMNDFSRLWLPLYLFRA